MSEPTESPVAEPASEAPVEAPGEEPPVDLTAELADRDARLAAASAELQQALDSLAADRVKHEAAVLEITTERDRLRADLIAVNRAECIRRIASKHRDAVNTLIDATIVSQSVDMTSAAGVDLVVETVRRAVGGLSPVAHLPQECKETRNTKSSLPLGPTLGLRK